MDRRPDLRLRIVCVLLSAWVSTGIGGEPANPETPLEQAKRLAASKDQRERAQALQLLKSLAKPGTAQGDEAVLHYAEFCLRLHQEGVKGMLEEAKKSFTELRDGSHSRWGIWGKLDLWRIDALEDRRLQALDGLEQFLAKQDGGDHCVDAAYYLGELLAEDKEVITVEGENLVGKFVLEKGAAKIVAKKVQVVISDAANQFSDLKTVKVTFNTEEQAGAGYKPVVENAGGKTDETGFEIVP